LPTPRQLKLWPTLPITHVIAKQSLVTEKQIHNWKANHKKIFVWTVNPRR